jgi:hypothetical protein
MKRKFTYYLFTMVLLLFGGTLLAQQSTINGKVISAEDQEGLPGVSIVAEGTGTGTVTDINGNYTINVAGNNPVLVFSYIGFATQTVAVGNRQTLDVVMETEAAGLDEFIVTAFGISQEKKSLGYAAQSIDAEAITKTKQPNLVNALQGQVYVCHQDVRFRRNAAGPLVGRVTRHYSGHHISMVLGRDIKVAYFSLRSGLNT